MLSNLKADLLTIFINEANEILPFGNIGIEKESMRTIDNSIANTRHNEKLGAPLFNKFITTDFSESLLEIVTPPFTNNDSLSIFLDDVHEFVYKNIDQETIWPFSIPPLFNSDEDIPIAKYGESNEAIFKMSYRSGLSLRYGRTMQAIAGIHFNYSFPDKLFNIPSIIEESLSIQKSKSILYFRMIRNLNRINWLILYLFGASPVVTKNFVSQGTSLRKLDDDFYYLPYATSLRMSDLGYKNNKQNNLKVSLNSLSEYISDLSYATNMENKEFSTIYKQTGNPLSQINNHTLQIEDEYYAMSRPKSNDQSGKRLLSKLLNSGVDYIELRSLDLNPFVRTGIDKHTINFLEAFMIYCAAAPSPKLSKDNLEEIQSNDFLVANKGRQEKLLLEKDHNKILLKDWANQIIDNMAPLATILEDLEPTLEYFRKKINDPSLTISAEVLTQHIDQKDTFYLDMQNKYKDFYLSKKQTANTHWPLFSFEASDSNLKLEKSAKGETQSYKEYLSEYFKI